VKISTIGLIAKPQSPLASSAIQKVADWGGNNGIKVLMDETSAKLIKGNGLEHQTLLKSVDALIVLGGDGTFLSAARRAANFNIPLLGVNLGSLGFITEVSFDDIDSALAVLKTGDFKIQERMILEMKVENGSTIKSKVALNDIVFSSKNLARMMALSITIDGEHVTRYKADGLIIATPTGSTAYALSAGGPILDPTIDAMAICPICPHTLSNRPLVIPGDSVIEVDIEKGQDVVMATIDGQESLDVNEHDHITVFRSQKVTHLLKVQGKTHFEILRNKLGWGGSANYDR